VAGGYPLISVAIPTRNRPDLGCRAVRNALSQTLKAIEVVIVVDGPGRCNGAGALCTGRFQGQREAATVCPRACRDSQRGSRSSARTKGRLTRRR
jgi:hypothetical protein